jgi:hypothetical protein
MEIPSAWRPATDCKEVRGLIQRMSIENPLWGTTNGTKRIAA